MLISNIVAKEIWLSATSKNVNEISEDVKNILNCKFLFERSLIQDKSFQMMMTFTKLN